LAGIAASAAGLYFLGLNNGVSSEVFIIWTAFAALLLALVSGIRALAEKKQAGRWLDLAKRGMLPGKVSTKPLAQPGTDIDGDPIPGLNSPVTQQKVEERAQAKAELDS
jgi:hypothetical protein